MTTWFISEHLWLYFNFKPWIDSKGTSDNEGLDEDDIDEEDEEELMMNGSMNGQTNGYKQIYHDGSDGTECDSDILPEDNKAVFVINMSLEMGVGKIAAQVAQAALGLQASLLRNSSKTRGRVSLERVL